MTTFNLTNISRPYDLVQTANNLTNNLFGSVMLLLFFVIGLLYLSTNERPFGYAFATSSFLTAIMAILFRVLAIVPDWVVYLSILSSIGGLAYVVFTKN